MREHNLYFAGLSVADSARLIGAALRVLFFGNRGYGVRADHLEQEFAQRFEGHDAVLFPSARVGTAVLLRALGVGVGDEVLITGYTCAAVPIAVVSAGAKPVYVDISPDDFAMNPAEVKTRITSRTRVLLMQHTYGIPARIDKLSALARSHGLVLLEDAVLGIGSAIGGRALGSFGAASIFSFELSKTITVGWGGIVVTRAPGLGQRLREIRAEFPALSRVEAARRLFQAGTSGFLYRPEAFRLSKYIVAVLFRLKLFKQSGTEVEDTGRLTAKAMMAPADEPWSIVSRQLGRLDRTTQRAAYIAQRYAAVLHEHGWPTPHLPDSVHLCRFPLLVRDPDVWVSYFRSHGFELGRWFDAPVSPAPEEPSLFHFEPGSCPQASLLSRQVINFPLDARMSNRDVERICALLRSKLVSLGSAGRFVAGTEGSIESSASANRQQDCGGYG